MKCQDTVQLHVDENVLNRNLISFVDKFDDFAGFVAAQIGQIRQVYDKTSNLEMVKRTFENVKFFKSRTSVATRLGIWHQVSQTFGSYTSNKGDV